MASVAFFRDEAGAVATDWIVLTAGIILLGAIVAISVMENSSGYLMDEFETLNEEYAGDAVAVSQLQDESPAMQEERTPGAGN